MCRSIFIPCDQQHTSDSGSFVGALLLSAAIGAAKVAWWLLEHLTVALIIAIVWTTPRVWRLARRSYRAGRRRWLMRAVVLDRQPVAAVTATTAPEQVLWSELMQKQEANAR